MLIGVGICLILDWRMGNQCSLSLSGGAMAVHLPIQRSISSAFPRIFLARPARS